MMERRGSEGVISTLFSQTTVKLLYLVSRNNLKQRHRVLKKSIDQHYLFLNRIFFLSELMKKVNLKLESS